MILIQFNSTEMRLVNSWSWNGRVWVGWKGFNYVNHDEWRWSRQTAWPSKFFCSIRVFFTDTENSQDSRGRERTIFYSTLALPPAHEHWGIYSQLCMWDGYHVFLIATLVFTRLLYSMRFTTLSTYHLSDWFMMQCLFVYLMNWY